jgi:hypothetical protein
VILREQFVERVSCSRPSLVWASSPPLAYSSRTAKERKGTFSFHARRFIGCGTCVHSLLTKRRERVVNRRKRLVNAHEERMREACYARCGDQELRLSKNRREARRRTSVRDLSRESGWACVNKPASDQLTHLSLTTRR